MSKREFLLKFCDNEVAWKHYFKLLNGQVYQGWITNILEETFEYLDSGPLSQDEPYFLKIDEIDTSSFAYYDSLNKKWVDY